MEASLCNFPFLLSSLPLQRLDKTIPPQSLLASRLFPSPVSKCRPLMVTVSADQNIGELEKKKPVQDNEAVTMRAVENVDGLQQKRSVQDNEGEVEKEDEIEKDKSKSETYSSVMTNAMGAVLTYRHEIGMNYNFVLPDIIVGSCLQTPADVDRLKSIGVKTVFCLQQDPDLEYFGVDINSIQERARDIGGIEHIRAQIRDFDAFDLRKRLPQVVATLHKAIERNKGIAYIHCTAGLGRAPAVALTYMYWMLGFELLEATSLILSVRPCFPKLESIKNATCDLLTGAAKGTVNLQWPSSDCQNVEVSGLDVGWGQTLPLTFVPSKDCWILKRELLVGKYEYKYVVDGNWLTNPDEPLTQPNRDGHINNYVEVVGNSTDPETKRIRCRLMQEDPALDDIERQIIRRKILTFQD